MTTVKISVGDRTVEAGPGESVSFGRSTDCDICLDADDLSISRRAGSLEYENQTWWLTNRSSARPLSVVDDLGFRVVLAPGRRTAVEAPLRVIIEAGRSHTLLIEVAVPPRPSRTDSAPPLPGQPTAVGESVMISPADRLAMVALFAGYLEEPPKYDPHPKSYAAAAARLGWPRTTLVKRIEYLRTRLDAAGVPNMMGWNALVNLAEYALTRGLVTKEDLQLLRR
jgi:hypothetical protein